MYTSEQKEKALALYDKTTSITEVIRRFVYSSRQAMYIWITNRNRPRVMDQMEHLFNLFRPCDDEDDIEEDDE